MWRRVIFSPYHQRQQPSRSTANNSTSSKRYEAFDYCVNLVHHRDRESYLCTLLLPAESRLCSFAVRAFNVELSSIPAMVSSQNVALMRFQFWSSTLENIFNESKRTVNSKTDSAAVVPEHPVAQALAFAVKERQLSRKWLSELIDGRVDRLDERRAFRTIKELEDYYQRIVGSVLFLLLECGNVRQVNADHAASHLGKALGLVNGLRSIGSNPERNVRLLPLELLLHHRVSQEDVVRLAVVKRRGRTVEGDVHKRLRDLTFDLASQAHVHLEQSRQVVSNDGNSKPKRGKGFDHSTRLVLLPSLVVKHYLGVLRQVDFDLFDNKFNSPYSWLPVTLWWRKFTKTY